jgi:hypothetical protein
MVLFYILLGCVEEAIWEKVWRDIVWLVRAKEVWGRDGGRWRCGEERVGGIGV